MVRTWWVIGLISFPVWATGCPAVETVAGDCFSQFSTRVTVLLGKALPSAEVRAAQWVVGTGPGLLEWHRLGKRVLLTAKRGRLYANGRKVRAKELQLKTESSGVLLEIFGRRYRGEMRAWADKRGVWVANRVSLDSYLEGTIGSEVSASWESEALKAQAVASRTYVLYRMRHPRSALYDLESGVVDQMYRGAEVEAPTLHAAVGLTRDQYLSRPSGEPLAALFHSRCGGRTETAAAVWNRDPTGRARGKSVDCPYCRLRPVGWRARFSWAQFLSAIGWPTQVASPEVRAGERLATGRWRSVEVHDESHRATLSADELRRRLGYDKLKSALFNWTSDSDGIEFTGRGNGHGVGLCQWGARHLAKQGFDYQTILSHYYPSIRLAKYSP